MKRFPLTQRLSGLAWVAGMSLMLAIPTVGVGLTLVMAMLPFALLVPLAEGSTGWVGPAAFALAVVAWALAAAGVAVTALRIFRRLPGLRAPMGEVAVGRDGLSLRRLFRRRFLSYRDVDTLEFGAGLPPTVVIRFEDGTSERLLSDDAANILEEAREAHARFRQGERLPAIDALRVEKDPLDEWLDRAQRLLSAAGFRDRAISEEELVRIVESPSADPAQRIGSALALSKSPEATRVRLRVAIEETADHELAEALGEAVEGKLRMRTLGRALD